MSSTIPNEQPMSKRQRIDSLAIVADGMNGDGSGDAPVRRAFAAIANGGIIDTNKDNLNGSSSSSSSAPPDILPTITPSYGPMSANKSTTSTMPASDLVDTDEMDNASVGDIIILKRIENAYSSTSKSNGRHDGEFPDLLKTTGGIATAIASTSNRIVHSKSVSSVASTRSCSSSSNSKTSNETSHRTSVGASNLDEFQLHLMSQCLCDISDRVLRRPFESYTYKDDMGHKHSVPLNEWHEDKVIEFLSNIQFLFDVYLKQNAKGQICTRIMQLCDALVCNEPNIIDDIFNLHEYNNKYVQFLAGRVMASCLVIAKDKEELYDNWLTTLVGNLVIDHHHGEFGALRKITFSLEIILRILEWRDKEQHPLEDKVAMDGRGFGDGDEQITVPVIVPPIENNYFAIHYNTEAAASPLTPPMTSSSQMREASPPLTPPVPSTTTTTTSTTAASSISNAKCNSATLSATATATSTRPDTTCHLQTLSDSESFDTKDLKCNIVNALKNKWSNLVDSMRNCISVLRQNHRNHRYAKYAENAILTFLTLWEHIISVKANLSVDSTLPFHKELTKFQKILISGNLSVAIYKQILTLLNESMCYATTLALQSDSELPKETTELAEDIFISVQDQTIFSSLPAQQTMPKNEIGFIGYKRRTIVYRAYGRDSDDDDDDDRDDDDDDDDHIERNPFLAANPSSILHSSNAHSNGNDAHKSNDRILLQKLVLLILKAIAVTMKPVRGDDSSDSSMDGSNSNSSTDYEGYQNTIQIERATREVLKKLIEFMKRKLNHHPETHFSKMIAHLFSDQDDYLIEAMICIVDTTAAFEPRSPFATSFVASDRNPFQTLINMLNPVYSFLELLELISFKPEVLLDFLISEETCFLCYLLRFLKYIRNDWNTFRSRCDDWPSPDNGRIGLRGVRDDSALARAMNTLTQLRVRIDQLVLQAIFPYPISPVLNLLRQCESLYEDPIA